MDKREEEAAYELKAIARTMTAFAKIADNKHAELTRLQSENAALREALEASGYTKALYSGEFKMPITIAAYDKDGAPFEETSFYTIPWTNIKEIMAAIKARALAAGRK